MGSSGDAEERGGGEGTSPSPRRDDPESIGPYRLIEVLGQGGMGIVYLGEQTSPVHRRVALKIIKLGMDTEEVVRRFESERQALAVMNHPGIAKVFDAGATETGRPYFVMELVHGVPITEYADTHRLTTRERLALLLDVCAAVQHAHQKGVIHRDLKPSNLLVTVQESRPLVKVIDFGVAKAIGRPLTDQTLVTHVGQMIGTPEYMSPEQAEMSGLDVDTRTDVYALGVVLYELLVGALPFDLSNRPAIAIPFALREADTPPPSSRLTGLGKQSTAVAQHRRTTPESLRRQLRGDLDWIILKAMDKDRTRRYDTAHSLALDIERYLANEPVAARPPSAGYRLAKFVRRHRAGVSAAAVAVAAILVGAGAAATGLVRARRAQAAAEREAETTKRTSDFLLGLFKVSDPSESRGNSITAREILDRGAEQVQTELAGQPLVQGRMMRTIGAVYNELGLYHRARPFLQRAVELARTAGSDEDVARSLERLGLLDGDQGRFADAERELKEALTLTSKLHGDDDTGMAMVTSSLGSLYLQHSRPRDAIPFLRRSLELYRRDQGTESAEIATLLTNIGMGFYAEQGYDSARVYLQRGLAMRTGLLPANSPEVADSWNNLGAIYYEQGDYAAAADAYEHARDIYEKVYAPDHPTMAALFNNLAEVHWRQKHYAAAEREFRRAYDILSGLVRPDHPSLAVIMEGLANVYRDEGRYPAADSLYRRAISIREKVGTNDNTDLVRYLGDYATLLDRMNRTADAAAVRARAAGLRPASQDR